MKANTKKVEVKNNSKKLNKNTKVEVVSTPNVPNDSIQKIREEYGKCAIIINGNMVFRTSTRVLEKGPKSLLDLYLPNYGKMRKFVVRDNKVYEITTNTIQTGTMFAQYELGEQVKMDVSEIDFSNEVAWNTKKSAE